MERFIPSCAILTDREIREIFTSLQLRHMRNARIIFINDRKLAVCELSLKHGDN